MKYLLLLYSQYLKPIIYCMTAMTVLMGSLLLIKELTAIDTASTTGMRVWVLIICITALYWTIWFVVKGFSSAWERKND